MDSLGETGAFDQAARMVGVFLACTSQPTIFATEEVLDQVQPVEQAADRGREVALDVPAPHDVGCGGTDPLRLGICRVVPGRSRRCTLSWARRTRQKLDSDAMYTPWSARRGTICVGGRPRCLGALQTARMASSPIGAQAVGRDPRGAGAPVHQTAVAFCQRSPTALRACRQAQHHAGGRGTRPSPCAVSAIRSSTKARVSGPLMRPRRPPQIARAFCQHQQGGRLGQGLFLPARHAPGPETPGAGHTGWAPQARSPGGHRPRRRDSVAPSS
jgi:hypothetical protein